MRLAILILSFLLLATAPGYSQQLNGDVNCSGGVNILDVTYTINYLYKSGPAPCAFLSPGVSYTHIDDITIDVGYSYSTLCGVSITAPDDGFVSLDFSLYIGGEVYCLQYAVGTMRDKSAWTEITAFSTNTPMSWHQIFPIDSGLNYYTLAVRGCLRDGDEEKSDVDFYNVNLSATYYPDYLGPRKE
nr:hypothetical protein [candidate division Zixibacteria bacterium]